MTPQLIRSIPELRRALAELRSRGRSIGLVPTMGALHAGHARLIEAAAGESNCVVVSIFVNPIQFDRSDDYDRYPRTLSTDAAFCSARGVDFVFAPSAEEMYQRPLHAFVEVVRITDHLCGKFRPGHFRGVATVVLKLLNIVQPDRAYFGEKDAQQLAVIRRLVDDLNVPVTIVGVPTVREPDGLALSSRNHQLNPEERQVATVLYGALQKAEALIAASERCSPRVKNEVMPLFAQHPEVRLEYFEIVDPDEMQPVDQITGPVLAAGAVWVGATRLIDNLLCKPA